MNNSQASGIFTALVALICSAGPARAQDMPVHDVTDAAYAGGATPDNDGDDDAPAFLEAIADADANVGGTNIVWIPPGTFDLDVELDEAGEAGAYMLEVTDVVIRGSGPASVVRMKEGTFEDRNLLFHVNGSTRIRFEDLTLDGNRSNIETSDAQIHLVQVNDSTDVTFSRVTFREGLGDGVYVMTSAIYHDTERVEIDRCAFTGFDRNGISVQHTVSDVRIHDSQFSEIAHASIDFEPSAGPGAAKISITGNRIGPSVESPVSAVSISGGDTAATDVVFAKNHVEGLIDGTLLERAVFAGNYIKNDQANTFALFLNESILDVAVSNNVIIATGSGSGLRLGADESSEPSRITVSSNIIEVESGKGIEISDAPTGLIALHGNVLSASDPSTVEKGIFVANMQSGTSEAFSITGNILSGFLTGVEFLTQNSGADLTGANVVGNSFIARSSLSSKGTSCGTGVGATLPSPTLSTNYWNATTENDGC